MVVATHDCGSYRRAHLPSELGDFPSSVTPSPLVSVPSALLTSPSPHLRLLLSLDRIPPSVYPPSPPLHYLSPTSFSPNAFFVFNRHMRPRASSSALATDCCSTSQSPAVAAPRARAAAAVLPLSHYLLQRHSAKVVAALSCTHISGVFSTATPCRTGPARLPTSPSVHSQRHRAVCMES